VRYFEGELSDAGREGSGVPVTEYQIPTKKIAIVSPTTFPVADAEPTLSATSFMLSPTLSRWRLFTLGSEAEM